MVTISGFPVVEAYVNLTRTAFIGEIYAASEGTWYLSWDGQYLWATQRTNENWQDAKLYQIEIIDTTIIPEFSTLMIFFAFIVATAAIIIYGKKPSKKRIR